MSSNNNQDIWNVPFQSIYMFIRHVERLRSVGTSRQIDDLITEFERIVPTIKEYSAKLQANDSSYIANELQQITSLIEHINSDLERVHTPQVNLFHIHAN